MSNHKDDLEVDPSCLKASEALTNDILQNYAKKNSYDASCRNLKKFTIVRLLINIAYFQIGELRYS